ncbi:sorting nexin family protein [Arthroderma uncinatum]|uniref:sorting nexin family protein n=1 Tax=Arthroderma uncinatum TaxID=74035 RepID=UPI00144A8F45|nr:sorting nexin family protein [Arthroderma uncinatum]KAF3491815.1 sorting nexin family protein [Arthroderma uncinatum]
MDHNDFDSVSWRNDGDSDVSRPATSYTDIDNASSSRDDPNGKRRMSSAEDEVLSPTHEGAGGFMGGLDNGMIECTVDTPLKENEGTKDVYVSYLVSTHVGLPCLFTSYYHNNYEASTDKTDFSVRRRFTDFYFLYNTLFREYPACAVPPLPDKHKMEYVRGDRFGPEFTQRRAWSLHRFIKRITLHPVLRRAPVLVTFLESGEWNAHMRMRPSRSSTNASDGGSNIFDNFADTFVNAFTKVHKPDKRFTEVREKADKLDEDLSHVEKIVARVARRESDLETDYAELAMQFRKLVPLEPELEVPLQIFAGSVEETSYGIQDLKEHTDQNYLGSLRDMEAYILSLKTLLKTREQKQLDYEALVDYLNKAVAERDTLTNNPSSYYATNPLTSNPASFLRSKMEDIRGVDHEQSRREKVRKLELRIDELTREVESAKTTSEMFDEEVVREVTDFERIKAIEFRDTLGAMTQKQVDFYQGVLATWERFIVEMEVDGDGDDVGAKRDVKAKKPQIGAA